MSANPICNGDVQKAYRVCAYQEGGRRDEPAPWDEDYSLVDSLQRSSEVSVSLTETADKIWIEAMANECCYSASQATKARMGRLSEWLSSNLLYVGIISWLQEGEVKKWWLETNSEEDRPVR